MIAIRPSAVSAFEAHARSAYPEECCGLLLAASWTLVAEPGAPAVGPEAAIEIVDVIPAQNLAHANRSVRYTLDPRAYIHAERQAQQRGLIVAGCYHSHPDEQAIPSATDASLAWESFVYLIIPVARAVPGAARAWCYVNHTPVELAWAILQGGGSPADSLSRRS
jgi:proteasome lid subunit RPN8/RPN11